MILFEHRRGGLDTVSRGHAQIGAPSPLGPQRYGDLAKAFRKRMHC